MNQTKDEYLKLKIENENLKNENIRLIRMLLQIKELLVNANA